MTVVGLFTNSLNLDLNSYSPRHQFAGLYFGLENLVLWARSEFTGSARRYGAKFEVN